MNKILHIFLKDVRGLRWQIPLMLAAAFGYSLWPWALLLTLFQYFIVARVIHLDALAGDRQFWVTRPISWKSLLTAKVLFIAVFVIVPALIADWAVLLREGLTPMSHLPGLLCRAAATGLLLLPAAAVAAATRNIAQFIVANIALLFIEIPLFILYPSLNWQSLQWAQETTMIPPYLSISVVALLWQYARRRTAPALGLLAFGSILVVVLCATNRWDTALAFVYHSAPQSGDSSIHLTFDPEPQPSLYEGHFAPGRESATVYVPLRVEGVPEDAEIAFDAGALEIQSEDGNIWRSGWSPWVFPTRSEGAPSARLSRATLGLPADPAFLKKVQHSLVIMRVTLAFTVFRNESSVNLTAQPGARVVIPDLGVCSYTDDQTLECRSALRLPGQRLAIRAVPDTLCGGGQATDAGRLLDVRTSYSTSPYPSESGSLPGPLKILRTFLRPQGPFRVCTGTELQIVIQRPTDHIRQEVTISKRPMEDYLFQFSPHPFSRS